MIKNTKHKTIEYSELLSNIERKGIETAVHFRVEVYKMLLQIRNAFCLLKYDKHKNKYNKIVRKDGHYCVGIVNLMKSMWSNVQLGGNKSNKVVYNCGVNHYDVPVYEYRGVSLDWIRDVICIEEEQIARDGDKITEFWKNRLKKLGKNTNVAESQKELVEKVDIGVNRLAYQQRWKEEIENKKGEGWNRNKRTQDISVLKNEKARTALPDQGSIVEEAKLSILVNKAADEYQKAVKTKNQDKLRCKLEEEMNELKRYCVEEDKIVVNTDKTNRNTIMTKEEYIQEGNKFIEENVCYRRQYNKAEIKKVEKRANTIMRKMGTNMKLTKAEMERTLVVGSKPAEVFFQVKDHKEPNKLRAIANIHGTPYERVDELLAQILNEASELIPTQVKNWEEMKIKMDEYNVMEKDDNKNRRMLSLDIEAMYDSIPCGKANGVVLNFIEERIGWKFGLNRNNVREMLRFITGNYYVAFADKVYKQVKGVPMGARFSCAYAMIYAYEVEKKALKRLDDEGIEVLVYGRYVDDILMIAQASKTMENIEDTIKSIYNSVDVDIKFEMEIPTDQSRLAFLDTDLEIVDEFVEYRWYMKEMHSGNYMTWQGHGSMVTKKNFVINRFACIRERCNTDRALKISMYRITELLIRAGYPLKKIMDWSKIGLNKVKNNDKETWKDKTENKCILKLPFITDECNRNIKKQIKKLDMEVELVNSKYKRIRAINKYPEGFKKTKCGCLACDALPEGQLCEECRVVYEIKCKECSNEEPTKYIGKTNNTLGMRLKNHISDVTLQKNSPLVDHLKERHGNKIISNTLEFYDCFGVNVLHKDVSTVNNHIKEAYEINKQKPKLNRKEEKEDWEVPIVLAKNMFAS